MNRTPSKAYASLRDTERRMAIALDKMTPRQRGIFLALRYDHASYADLALHHDMTVDQVIDEFANALIIVRRCLHARYPRLVWPWR